VESVFRAASLESAGAAMDRPVDLPIDAPGYGVYTNERVRTAFRRAGKIPARVP